MKAKEYLQQARFLDMSIQSKVEQIQRLNELATSCSIVIDDMPRNPNRGGSKMANTVMRIIELKDQVSDDMAMLVKLKQDIIALIQIVDRIEYRTILESRYLNYSTWEKIAVEIGYSIQYTYRLHDEALTTVQKIMDQNPTYH